MWAGLAGGWIVRRKDGVFTTWRFGRAGAEEQVADLEVDTQGTAWIAAASGLHRIPPGGTAIEKAVIPGLASDADSVDVLPEADGSLLVAARQGIVRVRDGGVVETLAEARAHVLVSDGKGGLVAITNDALLLLPKGGPPRSLGTKDGLPLPPDLLRVALADHDGCLFLGASSGGLVRFVNGRFDTLRREQGLGGASVSALLEDTEGGSLGGHARRAHASSRHLVPDLRCSRGVAFGRIVHGARRARRNRLHRQRRRRPQRDPRGSGDEFRAPRGDVLDRRARREPGRRDLGRWPEGLLSRPRNAAQPIALKGDVPTEPTAFLFDEKGSVLVGTFDGGLFRVQGDRIAKVEIPNGPTGEIVFLSRLRDGTVAAGTEREGLFFLREESATGALGVARPAHDRRRASGGERRVRSRGSWRSYRTAGAPPRGRLRWRHCGRARRPGRRSWASVRGSSTTPSMRS